MKRVPRLLPCLLFALVALPVPGGEKPTLLVVGVAGQVDARWNDHRIGFGIRNLIAEGLYGRFTLLEEKQEITALTDAIAERAWRLKGKPYDFEKDIAALAERRQADYLVYGHVTLFATPAQSIEIPLVSYRQVKTNIRVEVTLIHLATGRRWTGEAGGSARAKAASMLFVIRDDAVIFKRSTVGRATRKAVNKALADLFAVWDPI
ncbi:MAG: hypothetical protein QNK37_25625 [Acidobacteriota bacterium]|nr:hypothetical protein [Acidobacteriota bacterium]